MPERIEFRKGDKLTVESLEKRLRAERVKIYGPAVRRTHAGILIDTGDGGPAAATITGLIYCRITSKAGSEPPFVYSAEQVEQDTGGNWSVVGEGVILSANLYNLYEDGIGGEWVSALNVGDVVQAFPAAGTSGRYYCTRSTNRGTY